MSREFLKYAGYAVVGLLVVVAAIVFFNRGSHVVINGSILNVRTEAMNNTSSVAVVDFRFVNPSDFTFVVRTTSVILEDGEGLEHRAKPVSVKEIERLFQYYPSLGQREYEPLTVRDELEPDQSMDRMICALFDVPVDTINKRKHLVIRVEDVDGVVSDISEEPFDAPK